MKNALRQKNMSMPVWTSRAIIVEVERIVMFTCVRQIVGFQASRENGLQLFMCKLILSSVQCMLATRHDAHMLCGLNGV
jgi:hypothetical protein